MSNVMYAIISLVSAIPLLYCIYKIDQNNLTDKEFIKYSVGYLISGLAYACVGIILVFVDTGCIK